MRRVALVGVVVGLMLSSMAPVRAQIAQTAPVQPVVLKVDVVLSRSQGDKKISNLPFTMLLSPTGGYGDQRSMRVGVDVPVGNSTIVQGPSPSSSNPTTTTSARVDYRNIGTSLDARVSQFIIIDNKPVPLEAGRYLVDVRVSDSAIYGASDTTSPSSFKSADASAFRTFSMSNAMVMRDGQTLQFAMATDKTSGETLKLDVTMTVVK